MPVPVESNVVSGDSRFDPYRGTTTVGIVCKNGLVFATDTRVTQGSSFIAHKHGKKVFMIDSHAGVTIAGGVADAQAVVDALRYQARVYRIERNIPMPISSLSNIASLIMFQKRFEPLQIQALIGGLDHHGPTLFQLDPFGGVSHEIFAGTGSGSPVALGFLEANIGDGISIEECIPIAAQSITVAMNRDTATGNDFDIAIIDEGGYRELDADGKNMISEKIIKRGTHR